ncbi:MULTISPECIES: hypothetical protein [Aerococcus]|uniref:Uncharacterized protein n=1 Tax=Aerococcus tenax TaxID=3078812 RepID=A0A5N1BLQ5_9LACT|nr:MULTISPECIES: hypothetical protein [Aerococcus]MDL5184740.1 hypothetical protein [Aerococcus mictus]KAA9238603.1 hypothetical protein F6I34_08140 [Aerococcus urinae]MDK6371965.1 hypothetical protein [Aerococcus urinae]MDK7302406.1 hypothetical protein [Aerococcus urinae]MDK7802264.1 hypothetical protein [Aerococcus urinae]
MKTKDFTKILWVRQQIKRSLLLFIKTGDIEHYQDMERVIDYVRSSENQDQKWSRSKQIVF